MLTFAVIHANPAGTTVVSLFGIIVFAMLAAIAVGLWILVARRIARGGVANIDGGAADPELESLEHRRLLVRRARGRPGAVVVELVPDDESNINSPVAPTRSPEKVGR